MKNKQSTHEMIAAMIEQDGESILNDEGVDRKVCNRIARRILRLIARRQRSGTAHKKKK